MLAKFATDHNFSKGRLYKEEKEPYLSLFEVDINRIIESKSFRRLGYKTQVFFTKKEDHYRNRLTHSLEAAEIAKTISKALNVDKDLSEAIALAHDLGHAPFGHAGEEALNKVLEEFGLSFDHNLHTLKLVTEIEKQYPNFEGLNLSFEVMDGLIKHNGPYINRHIPGSLSSYAKTYDINLTKAASLEAQISSLSDDIAYSNHDIDDGFKAGFIFLSDLEKIDIINDVIKKIKIKHPKADEPILIYETVRQMRQLMMEDLIISTRNNLKKYNIENSQEIISLSHNIVCFSHEIESYTKIIKDFLMERVYQNHKVIEITHRAKRILKELFYLYLENPTCLPIFIKKQLKNDKKQDALLISNFIACMSDRHAISEYRSFFELTTSYIK